MSDHTGISLLFSKPLEPTFAITEDSTSLHLPESFYTDHYKNRVSNINVATRSANQIIINDVDEQPDLSFADLVPRKKNFSLFNERHIKIAGRVIELFMNAKDYKTFESLATYCRDRLNTVLFQYALSVAVEHRPDTRDLTPPTMVHLFPNLFVDPNAIPAARIEMRNVSDENDRVRIEIERNFTASEREEEQRLAYFREDIGINLHHWHWHSVYPQDGPLEIVDKDRRGELFYYMHHQINARYNCERFANNLPRVKPLKNLLEPISEGYFPKILSSSNNRTFPSRHQNTIIKDVERDDITVTVNDLMRWNDRVHEAIDRGYADGATGERIPFTEEKGIDILGNILEASILSVNPRYYGNVHIMGHILIAYTHDPDDRFREDCSVMGEISTAMRDPVFYRWHSHIDSLFMKYKYTLPDYSDEELEYPGITINSIQVRTTGVEKNQLVTHWKKSDVDLAAALDFGGSGPALASFTHLQHLAFEYKIKVNNTSGSAKKGTCRIILCPKVDEMSESLKLKDVQLFSIELDKFTVNLRPGQNVIKRKSDQSSVTIPYERSFRPLTGVAGEKSNDQTYQFRYCGCGWPNHMLIPKGTPSGMRFDLFVMISNADDDDVIQTNNSTHECDDAQSFCGLKDKLYPDKRAMGYPFDRKISDDSLGDFVNRYSNIKIQEITIKHMNSILKE